LRSINFNSHVVNTNHAKGNAILKKSKTFNFFCRLEWSDWPFCKINQCFFSESVYTDVLIIDDRGLRVSRVRNYTSAKKERIHVVIHRDFYKVWIVDFFLIG